MERQAYISDGTVALVEYVDARDDAGCYRCWLDPDTQRGYNHNVTETFEEFAQGSIQSRFAATIVRLMDGAHIGYMFLSTDESAPDLAIMLDRAYRGQGYGSAAFSLGARYCFEAFPVPALYAGCYEDNAPSLAMLKKCGFVPHPEGNQAEKHFLTGEDIVQMDFVLYSHRP